MVDHAADLASSAALMEALCRQAGAPPKPSTMLLSPKERWLGGITTMASEYPLQIITTGVPPWGNASLYWGGPRAHQALGPREPGQGWTRGYCWSWYRMPYRQLAVLG